MAKTTGGPSKLVKQSHPLPPSVKKQTENIKKGVDLVSKTITLHLHPTFWYISLPSLYADYHVKLPNFTFEDVKRRQQIFLSLFQ